MFPGALANNGRRDTGPSLTEAENLFCGLHTICLLILLPKSRETSIGPIRQTLSVDPAISYLEIAMGRQKFKMCKSLQIGARKLLNEERIPSLALEFTSDSI